MILTPNIPPEHPSLASYVNTFLPEQIRMWGFVRTMKSFQARTYASYKLVWFPKLIRCRACDSRIYEYLHPSYCLLPPSSSDPLAKQLDASSPSWRDKVGPAAAFADASPDLPPEGEGNQADPKQRGEYERRRAWRVDEGTVKRFRDLVAEFKGTQWVTLTARQIEDLADV